MKFALIGKGFISPRHIKAVQEIGGEIILTCDIDESKNANYTDWKELFESKRFKDDVDTVIICTPNYTHAEIVRAAIKTGKRVICEKPLCIDSEDINSLQGVNTVLQLRYNPEVLAIKENITNGHSISINIRTFREQQYWDSWKGDPQRSGGVLYNMGVHYIDLLIFLLGNPEKILVAESNDRVAKGIVHFEKGIGQYHIELLSEPGETVRELMIDGNVMEIEGATIPLQAGLQVKRQDLHTEVYKAFIKGDGIPLYEARKSLELVHNLYAANGK